MLTEQKPINENWEKLQEGLYRYKKDAALILQDALLIETYKICYLFDTHGVVEGLEKAMQQAEKWYNHKFKGLIK